MAGRRCLSSKITESDPFYALPDNAQSLYLHLSMQADDDGFINNAVSVSNRIKGGAAALKRLVDKRFLLKFDDVYVIKHWRISNSLKNDRLKPLAYASIAQKLWVKSNKAYTDHPVPGCITLYELRTGAKPPEDWNPNGIQSDSGLFPIGILTEPNLTKPNITEPNLTEPKDLGAVFRAVLLAYPEGRTGNAAAAEDAFRQAVLNADDARLITENLELWKRSEQWDKEGGKYIPYLCNWILRGTWREKPAKLVSNGPRELDVFEIEAIRRMMDGSTDRALGLSEDCHP